MVLSLAMMATCLPSFSDDVDEASTADSALGGVKGEKESECLRILDGLKQLFVEVTQDLESGGSIDKQRAKRTHSMGRLFRYMAQKGILRMRGKGNPFARLFAQFG